MDRCHELSSVVIDNFDLPGIAIRERKQIRHGPFTIIAHCPFRDPVNLCRPTDLSGLRSSSDEAASNAASKSSAASVSIPENLLFPLSANCLVAVFAHDRIMDGHTTENVVRQPNQTLPRILRRIGD